MTQITFHTPRPAIPFDPVPCKARFDGWTPEKQADFIDTLAATGNVTRSCAAVGMQFAGAYRLRNRPDAASFRAAWDAAVETGTQAIRDILIDHSLNGIPEDVWHAGKKVGERRRFNHRSMMWIVEHGDRLRAARAADEDPDDNDEEAVAAIMHRLDILQNARLREHATDPVKRAAWEMLHGPVDWDALTAEGPQNRLQ